MGPELPLQVLVVDGDPGIQHLLGVILQKQGWQVGQAGDGEEALELLHADLPDVLLIDLILPRRSGLDVLRWIDRSDPDWLRHVVVLTGAAGSLLADLSTVHSVGCVMRKPFDLDDLVHSVESCAQTLVTADLHRGYVAGGTRA